MNQAGTVATESTATAVPAPGVSYVPMAVGTLALLALICALYLARGFFVPLLIGIIASYTLHPLVDGLQAWRVPRSVGAALVLALVVGSFSWIGFSLSDDAVAVIEKLPEAARKLRRDLSSARSGGPTALQNMQEVASELQAQRGLVPSETARPEIFPTHSVGFSRIRD